MFKDFKNFLVALSNYYEEAGLAKGGNTTVASSRLFKAQSKLKSVCLAQPKNHSHNKKPNKRFIASSNHLLCPYAVTEKSSINPTFFTSHYSQTKAIFDF